VKTDLQKEGLIGSVRTVRIEEARFSNQSGHWVEEPRRLSARITYDGRGNKTEEIGSEAVGKTLYIHDARGRRTEEPHYSSSGTFYSKLIYTYHEKDKLTTTISSDSFHFPPDNKTDYTYDEKGRLIAETVYGPGLAFKDRAIHGYDAQGHRSSTTTHDGALGVDKVVTTYDARDIILEETTYYTEKVEMEDRPVPPPAKRIYTYEWDAHGNWIKQTETMCHAESGTMVCEPSLMTYRTIIYYREAGISAP